MAYLKLNGWTIPVIPGSTQTDLEIGSRDQAFDGTYMQDRRATKRIWNFKTKPLNEFDAEALRLLIGGYGYYWPFDSDNYSRMKFLAPSGTPITTIRSSVSSVGSLSVYDESDALESKYGTGSVAVESGSTNVLSNNVATGTDTSANTTGFTATGGGSPATLTSVTTQAWQGSRSLQVATGGAGSGCEILSSYAVTAGQTYTASLYGMKSTATGGVTLVVTYTGTGTTSTSTTRTLTTDWRRMVHTFTVPALATAMTITFTPTTSGTYFLDGLMVAQTSTLTSWTTGARSTGSCAFTGLGSSLQDFTLACWACTSTTTIAANRTLMSVQNSSVARVQVYVPSGTTNVAATYTSGSTMTATSVMNGTWRHIATTVRINPETGENARVLYIDGAASQSVASLTEPSAASLDLGIGNDSTGANFGNNIRLDGVILLPYAATASQIAAIYNLGTPPGAIPYIIASGDFVKETYVTVQGKLNEKPNVTYTDASTYRSNGSVIDFTLQEV